MITDELKQIVETSLRETATEAFALGVKVGEKTQSCFSWRAFMIGYFAAIAIRLAYDLIVVS